MTQLEENIIKEYQDGYSMNDIQKKYNIGYKKVRNTLIRNNIQIRKHNQFTEKAIEKHRRILTKEEEQIVCDTYKKTYRIKDCEKAIHAGQDVIRRCLQKYELYRTQSEAAKATSNNNIKYPINEDFFKKENEDMAYVLGFFAADGTVRKDTNEMKISLSTKDRELLEKFKQLIGGRNIKDYVSNKGYEISSWSFSSKYVKEKFAEYNIVPNKTFIFKFPENLNKKYWIDFIRGYFDGDGSISTAGPHAIRWQLGSATKDVLEHIINFFYEEYNISKPTIFERNRENEHTYYYFQYSSTPTREIYKHLYYDNCLCLKRKKEKFEEII